MGLRLRPVEGEFYQLFGEFGPHLTKGTALLADMLDPASDREAIAESMRNLEHDADETTHAIVRKVNSSFVTPFDREDIYSLATGLDDIMDAMDEAVDLVLLYDVGELPQGVSELVDILRDCATATHEALPRLRNMSMLNDFWVEINRLENKGDRVYRRILARLFDGSFDALEVIKLKDIVMALEEAIDSFEEVAMTVEQLAVKES